MKEKTGIWLLVLLIIIMLSNPILFILGLVGICIYFSNKNTKIKKAALKFAQKYKDADKTSNYEVIDTSAEVIDSKVINEKEEWKATKEYRH